MELQMLWLCSGRLTLADNYRICIIKVNIPNKRLQIGTPHIFWKDERKMGIENGALFDSLLHTCKYCGVETTQPDDQCYKAPPSDAINTTLGATKCSYGWDDGSCCCNCKHQIELRRHPMNNGFGKGSIMNSCGWVCLNPEITEGKSGIYFDNQHGMCECYMRR